MSKELADSQAAQNTDREIWREREGDYYADSIHVTKQGSIGINCGGTVIVKPVREWHKEAIAALRSEPAAWMPIDTAPKNHFPILVSGPYGRLVAFRDVTWAWWPCPASEALDYKPTHWMPLPAAPSRESRTDRQEPGLSANLIKRAQWLHEQVHRKLEDASVSNDNWTRYNANLEHFYKEHFPSLCAMALRSLTARDEAELLREAQGRLYEVCGAAQRHFPDLMRRIDAYLSRKEPK